ncbi:MAG TPA: DUF6134 family protein [Chitinophagales bacterium]|nr:DUF6134 family protein [Chitinophagales bacterium]
MKFAFAFFMLSWFANAHSQKHVYNVELFGKKIGTTTVEKIDKGNGTVEYLLSSASEVTLLFTKKTSIMNFDVVYKDGKLFSSYCKNVKDDATEVVTILWDGLKYVIKRGEEILQLNTPIDYSTILLYYIEPKGRPMVFSERQGRYTTFQALGGGVYEYKQDNGVDNIYRYRNGVLYELEMNKGASVFMRLVQ